MIGDNRIFLFKYILYPDPASWNYEIELRSNGVRTQMVITKYQYDQLKGNAVEQDMPQGKYVLFDKTPQA